MIKELLLLYTSSWAVWFMISVGIYLVGQVLVKLFGSFHLWEDSRVTNNYFNKVDKDESQK